MTAAQTQQPQVIRYPDLTPPNEFTREELGWVPWLEPLPIEDLTERTMPARGPRTLGDLLSAARPRPRVLGARTLSTRTSSTTRMRTRPRRARARGGRGLPANGCIFCASVHARFAAHHSQRADGAATARRGHLGEQDDALDRDHRRRGRAHRTPRSHFGPAARRAAARGRARRPRDRRRRARRRVLQLGEPADAVARRADTTAR